MNDERNGSQVGCFLACHISRHSVHRSSFPFVTFRLTPYGSSRERPKGGDERADQGRERKDRKAYGSDMETVRLSVAFSLRFLVTSFHSSLRSPVTLFPSFIASQSPTFLWLILSALHSPSPRLTPRLAHSVGQEERSGT